jgi:hypothetical protein
MEKGAEWMLRRISLIGEHAERWSAAMMLARGVGGLRVLMGPDAPGPSHDSAASRGPAGSP